MKWEFDRHIVLPPGGHHMLIARSFSQARAIAEVDNRWPRTKTGEWRLPDGSPIRYVDHQRDMHGADARTDVVFLGPNVGMDSNTRQLLELARAMRLTMANVLDAPPAQNAEAIAAAHEAEKVLMLCIGGVCDGRTVYHHPDESFRQLDKPCTTAGFSPQLLAQNIDPNLVSRGIITVYRREEMIFGGEHEYILVAEGLTLRDAWRRLVQNYPPMKVYQERSRGR